MPTALELRERRARLIHQAREILDQADKEGRSLTAEEDQNWQRAHDDADHLLREIERIERQERADAEARSSTGVIAGRQDTEPPGDDHGGPSQEERERAELGAFNAYLRYGMAGLTAEQRDLMGRRYTALGPEHRALAAGVGAEGGFTVPEGFMTRLETAMKAFGGIRNSRATIIPSSSGNPLPMPTSDDTGNEGELLAENTQAGEQDVTFGQVVLGAHMYSSKLVKASIQLLQDTAFNIEAWLADRLGERLGRITNKHFTTGDGVNKPRGIVPASTQGATVAAAGATDAIYDALVDLVHSVDPAYRRQAEFMFSDDTLKKLKKLKDADNRPIWVPGLAVREPDTILSHPYVVNQEMPDFSAGNDAIVFGDLSKYHIRDVRGVQLLRLQERFAEFLQVGFLAFSRHDGDLLDAGTNPVKHLDLS